MTGNQADAEPLVVTRIGREGDGVVDRADGPVFIADALPGETYVANDSGGYARRGAASPSRITPPCRHFGTCGGCVAQHMDADTYRCWKQDLIRSAFGSQGVAVDFAPMFMVPPHSRRRAILTAMVRRDNVKLGFRARRSHVLIDLVECPVLDREIVEALPVLREIARHLASMAKAETELRIAVAALSGGLDIAIEGCGKALPAQVLVEIAKLSRASTIARVSAEGLVVFSERQPALATAAGEIIPPPAAFFQAVAQAEQEMASRVVEGIGKSKYVADLFCGVGTFTLPLAKRARVLAVDSDKPMLEALARASRMVQGLKPIETKRRNLMAEPLAPLELTGFDAVVLDPPRAGAKAQCEMLAKAKVARIVMVSCNPATLARDCRILVDAGWTMGRLHGIDQFLWSPHVEAIVVLDRRP